MMLIVIELCISCSNSSDKSSMLKYASTAFRILHGFEQIMQFIYQVVLLSIIWFPSQNMISERQAMEQHLNGRVYITNIRVLNVLYYAKTYIFEAKVFLVLREFILILVNGRAGFDGFLLFEFPFADRI